tara:strand:- start:115314 stop:115622 length:309 start_codon:yes stop_codon:yes gene_type:complete
MVPASGDGGRDLGGREDAGRLTPMSNPCAANEESHAMNEVAMMSRYYLSPRREPQMDDVLSDPVVHLVMARDGVTLDDMRDVVASARARLLFRQMLAAESSF